jgi:hypothetical protein
MTRRLPVIALLLAVAASVTAAFTLRFEMPKGWVPKAPSSSMRVAEFVLPKADGDAEDATLTVYSFPGGGGGVEANLERWIGQMSQPDGKASKDVAKTSTMTSTSGVKMTLVDVPGTYIAEVTPGSTERFNKPGFRLRAAVVETSTGPYYVKLTGPAKTVAKWDESYTAFLKSMKVE